VYIGYQYEPNDVSICSGLAAILNAEFLPAAITHLRRITVSYPSVNCSVRYSSVTTACMVLYTVGNRFLSVTGSQRLAFG